MLRVCWTAKNKIWWRLKKAKITPKRNSRALYEYVLIFDSFVSGTACYDAHKSLAYRELRQNSQPACRRLEDTSHTHTHTHTKGGVSKLLGTFNLCIYAAKGACICVYM